MPKQTTSKVQNKIQAKAAAKLKRHNPSAPIPEEGSKAFPILSTILKDKRSIIPIEELSKLDFQSKVKLIEEVSEYVLTAPENHVTSPLTPYYSTNTKLYRSFIFRLSCILVRTITLLLQRWVFSLQLKYSKTLLLCMRYK